MKKVKILLSCGRNLQNYVDAIRELGAEATASYLPAVDINFDGLIFYGADIFEHFLNMCQTNCGDE